MLQKFFLWFYCLSIPDAVFWVIAGSVGYLILRHRWHGKRFWRPAVSLLLLAWLAVVSAATLTDRIPGSRLAEPELLLFHSYRAVMAGGNIEILRSNFMNGVLFYPAGLLTLELLPGNWGPAKKLIFITALFALVSAGIEFCQYRYGLGVAEIDDVFHNMLGALLGALAGMIQFKWKPGESENPD